MDWIKTPILLMVFLLPAAFAHEAVLSIPPEHAMLSMPYHWQQADLSMIAFYEDSSVETVQSLAETNGLETPVLQTFTVCKNSYLQVRFDPVIMVRQNVLAHYDIEMRIK